MTFNRPGGESLPRFDSELTPRTSLWVARGNVKPPNVRELRKVLGRDSFAFSCTRCGNCCRGPGSVYFSKQEFGAVVEYLDLNRAAEKKLRASLIQHEENGYLVHNTPKACRFLDEKNGCSIYPVRPMQCRTFPFWASFFETPEDLDYLKAECPGVRSGRGTKYTLLQTIRRISATEKAFLSEQRDRSQPIQL